MNHKIRPFNLNNALKHPEWLYTKSGEAARIICTDAKCQAMHPMPLIVLVTTISGKEICLPYSSNGNCSYEDTESLESLVLRVPKPKTKWAVSYEGVAGKRGMVHELFNSIEEAQKVVYGKNIEYHLIEIENND